MDGKRAFGQHVGTVRAVFIHYLADAIMKPLDRAIVELLVVAAASAATSNLTANNRQ
jgi:hypothetical protein